MPASLPTQDGIFEALRLDRAAVIFSSPPLGLAEALAKLVARASCPDAGEPPAPPEPQPASSIARTNVTLWSLMAPDCAMAAALQVRSTRWPLSPPPNPPSH